jgi:hypothetical protein
MKAFAVIVVLVAVPILAGCGKEVLSATGGPDPNVVVTPNPLTNQLWAHYRFDEDGGTVVHDSAPQRRDGVLFGGMWLLDGGQFGGALHFDGDSGVIVNGFPDAPPDFTLSMWIRVAGAPPVVAFAGNMQVTSGFGTILSTEVVHQGGWQFNLEPVPDSGIATHFAYWETDAPENNAPHPLTLERCRCVVENQWIHFAAVVDSASNTLSLYVNGALVAPPMPDAGSILAGAPALYMGTWGGNTGPPRFLVGDIDDVAIYGRALSPSEVLALQSGPPPDMP